MFSALFNVTEETMVFALKRHLTIQKGNELNIFYNFWIRFLGPQTPAKRRPDERDTWPHHEPR
jgi:hypothetical protein